MATGILLQNGKQAFSDANGRPLAGGKVFFYVPNTLTPKDTFQDVAMTVLNTNPVILNARGEAVIIGTGAYRQILKDASDVTIWDQTLPDLLTSVEDALNTFFDEAPIIVDNIAQLRALDHTVNRNALTRGYYADGDKGAGRYYYDSTDTASPDNGGTVIVATDNARWKLIWSEQLNVRQFGAKGDNVTDDKAKIQAAIDAIAATGGIVFFPAGQYVINSGIEVLANGVTLQGASMYASQIIAGFATGHVISIGSDAVNVNNSGVRNLLVSNNVTRTSGAGIRLKNGHNLFINGLRSENQFEHVRMDGGTQQFIYHLDDFELNNGARGLAVGLDGSQVPQDLFLSRGLIAGCTDAGIFFQNASGVYMDRIDALSCRYGIQAFPAVGENVVAVWGTQILADTCTATGWFIQTGGGIVANWNLTGAWAATCGGSDPNNAGFLFEKGSGTMRNINLIAPVSIVNAGVGIAVSGVENFTMTDPNVGSNSTAASGTRAGVQFNTNTSGWSVTGGKIGLGAPFTLAASQSYGISIGAGCDGYVVAGVNLEGNALAGVQDLSTPADGTIVACPFYRTSNRGVASIIVGQTAVTIAHGLPFTPQPQDITAMFASAPAGSGVTSMYVTSVGAANFTLAVNTAVTTTALSVVWQATRRGN